MNIDFECEVGSLLKDLLRLRIDHPSIPKLMTYMQKNHPYIYDDLNSSICDHNSDT
jgi:hypothetical protein